MVFILDFQALAETDLRKQLLNLLDILSSSAGAPGAVDFHFQDKGYESSLIWAQILMSRRFVP